MSNMMIIFSLTTIIIIIIMLLLQRSVAKMSRRADHSMPSFDDIIEFKWKRLTRDLERYSSDDKFIHQDKLYEEFVYGHSCHIASTTQNSFDSQKFAKSAVKSLKPRILILGGISDNFLRVGQAKMRLRQKYEHPLYRPEKLMCRQRIARLIQTRLERDRDFYWDATKQEIVVTNHRDRRVMPSDYLTAAHMASLQGDTRIVLGRPSQELVFEDLIMRYSKQELAGVVKRAVGRAKERQSQEIFWRESYSLQAIQNYVMSQQPAVYSRELTFQAALLKRLAKIQDNILLLTPGYFVPRVAEQVHHIQITPQKVFRDGIDDPHSQSYALLDKTLRSDPNEILEKFALICLLRQNWIEKQFAMGTNVFKYMSFGSMFANEDINELKMKYMQAKEKASTQWYQLMKHRINNIHVLEQPTARISLQEQFTLVQERTSKSFPYTYEQKNFLTQYQNAAKLHQLEARMKEILNEQGDKHNIQIFDAFLKKRRSRQGIILYSKLLGKANIESHDRLKLPVFHYAAFRGIYKQYLREFILQAEANTKIQKRIQERISKTEKLTQELMKKLDNPYELNKYLTGQKGKVFHFNVDMEDGPSFSPQDLQQLKDIYGEMTAEDEKEMEEQYGDDWIQKKE